MGNDRIRIKEDIGEGMPGGVDYGPRQRRERWGEQINTLKKVHCKGQRRNRAELEEACVS